LDEFRHGLVHENSASSPRRTLGPRTHPRRFQRRVRGSSGSGECIAALGSDTARLHTAAGWPARRRRASNPPTQGSHRFGLVAFASSLDQIGPLTKDVTDSAIMMNAIAGHDPKDSTSADVPCPGFQVVARQGCERREGPASRRSTFIEGMDPRWTGVRDAVRTLEGLGAKVVDVTPCPHTATPWPRTTILATSEASSNARRSTGSSTGFRAEGAKDLLDQYMKSRSQGFGPEVKRRIMLGTYALSRRATTRSTTRRRQQVRTLIKRDFEEAFKFR